MANISRKVLKAARKAAKESGTLSQRGAVKEINCENYSDRPTSKPRMTFGFSEGTLVKVRRPAEARTDSELWRWERLEPGTLGLVIRGPYHEVPGKISWKVDMLVGSEMYKEVDAGKLVPIQDNDE